MPVICFCSPKGGVGKTSLSINTAGILARAGTRVLAVDLDVQNSLRLHAGVHLHDHRGWAPCLLQRRSLREGILPGGSNMLVMPFGQVSSSELKALTAYLESNPLWLRDALAPFIDNGFTVVLDTSPGPSVFLDQALSISTLDIIVLQADATSVSLISAVEEQRLAAPRPPGSPEATTRYVFSMVDRRRRMTRDLLQLIDQKLGAAVLGVVNYDDSFGDAVANQQLVSERAPASKAAQDLRQLATRIQETLQAGRQPGRKAG
jgi:cellulose synthase operon protein YhjQ